MPGDLDNFPRIQIHEDFAFHLRDFDPHIPNRVLRRCRRVRLGLEFHELRFQFEDGLLERKRRNWRVGGHVVSLDVSRLAAVGQLVTESRC